MFQQLSKNERYEFPAWKYYLWDISKGMYDQYWRSFIDSYSYYRKPIWPMYVSYSIHWEEWLIVTCNTYDGVWTYSWHVFYWEDAWHVEFSVHSWSIWMFNMNSAVATNDIYNYIKHTWVGTFINIWEYWTFEYNVDNWVYTVYDGNAIIAQIDTGWNFLFD